MTTSNKLQDILKVPQTCFNDLPFTCGDRGYEENQVLSSGYHTKEPTAVVITCPQAREVYKMLIGHIGCSQLQVTHYGDDSQERMQALQQGPWEAASQCEEGQVILFPPEDATGLLESFSSCCPRITGAGVWWGGAWPGDLLFRDSLEVGLRVK